MIDTRFETTIDLRGEIENYRQVALIKYYKILLELDPRRDRLTMLAVIRCIDKLERHSQERKRPRNDKKKMLAEGTLAWHYQKRNQLFRKAGLYDVESTQFLVDHEEIFDTHEEREERERFEACRREALRRKTETHEAEEKESVQPASAHEADKDLQEDYTTAGSGIPAHTPQPLSPLSGSIWCGAPAGNPIGEPAPGFHRSSFDCNRRE
ncbi:hypothetical protein [Barnesiella intestinihominis]|uniref:hypothetical protein n=1 Tax=Barnesiella intestinihominis TaxID=487174 RepID=UPI0032C1651D